MSRLLLVGKCLGAGYLLFALIVLVVGIARTIAFTIVVSEHRADIELLTIIPFVIFFILCLVIGFLLGLTGLRLWAARRTRLTWVVVCASIVAFPIGTILGIPSLIWLILLRRSQTIPPAFEAPISPTGH
jgi:uncharacterized membrane protein (DUF485 family)